MAHLTAESKEGISATEASGPNLVWHVGGSPLLLCAHAISSASSVSFDGLRIQVGNV